MLESSLPINSLSGRRYLNGRLICKLGAHEKAGLFIAVTDIQVPGRSVPAGFIDVYQRGIIPGKTFGFLDDALLRNFRADPAVSRTLARVKSVAASNGSVTLVTKAEAKPRRAGVAVRRPWEDSPSRLSASHQVRASRRTCNQPIGG